MTLAALMPLTRPEGFVVAPAWLALISLQPGKGARRFDLKRARPALITFTWTALGLTVYRWLYFGYPLPNTFYAKVSPSVGYNFREGTEYLLRSLINSPIAACALAIALAATMNLRRGDPPDEGCCCWSSPADWW